MTGTNSSETANHEPASDDTLRSLAITLAKLRLSVDRFAADIRLEIAERKARGEWRPSAQTGASFRRPGMAQQGHQKVTPGIRWDKEVHHDA